jgi:CubicO group peptidase (beta-lactamase class C family)
MQKVLILYLLFMPPNIYAQSSKTVLDTSVKQHNLLGGQLVIWKNNCIIESTAFGVANIELNRNYSIETQTRVASISKTITAIAIMQCVEQKLCKLNQDIGSILGFEVRNLYFKNAPITIEMLLSHTSSLNDGNSYDSFLSTTYNSEIIPSVDKLFLQNGEINSTSDMHLNKEPGTFFNYANINFGLLGTIVEKLQKIRFDLYAKENIFAPLSIIGDYLPENVTNLAAIYRKQNGEWQAQVDNIAMYNPFINKSNIDKYEIGSNALKFGPHGGLRISAIDLAKIFLMLQNKGRWNNKVILSSSSIKKMQLNFWTHTTENGNTENGIYQSYGLGLQRINNADFINAVFPLHKGTIYGHSGDAYGLHSHAYYAKQDKFGFVLILNGDENNYQRNTPSVFSLAESQLFELIYERLNEIN